MQTGTSASLPLAAHRLMERDAQQALAVWIQKELRGEDWEEISVKESSRMAQS